MRIQKNLLHFCVALSTAFLLSACSKISSAEVEASSIYGQIDVSRSESSSNVDVDASFYVGGQTGTMIYLVSPAAVTINGAAGNEVNDVITNRVHYENNVSATSAAATVLYTDKDGLSYTNSAAIPGIFYSSVPGSVSKASGFSVGFSSTQPFFSGERLEVTMSTNNASSYQSFSLVTNASSGNQSVSASTLQDFSPGNLSVSVCRVRDASAQAPYPKGLQFTVKSCANPVTVSLTL